jgi:hypothetical protein
MLILGGVPAICPACTDPLFSALTLSAFIAQPCVFLPAKHSGSHRRAPNFKLARAIERRPGQFARVDYWVQ